jgi:DNA-binding NarL/FixJ family response regulator
MESSPLSHPRDVVILKADRLCADTLRQIVLRVFPSAHIRIVASVERLGRLLTTAPTDLLLAGTEPVRDGDLLDFLSTFSAHHHPARQVLVVASHCEDRVLAALRTLPVHGVFDSACDPPDQLLVALRMVVNGARYWSPNLVDRMQRNHLGPNSLFRLLTSAEQLVLSIIGDGCDDVAAAAQLGLSPSTVSTVRRELHRKLGVQHRGELVRVAAQNGFVRFTPNGVTRPGFAMLAAACAPRHLGKRAVGTTASSPA